MYSYKILSFLWCKVRGRGQVEVMDAEEKRFRKDLISELRKLNKEMSEIARILNMPESTVRTLAHESDKEEEE